LAARYASDAVVDIPETARKVIDSIGYWPEDFDSAECTVVTSLIEQQKSVRETDFTALEDNEIDRITVSHQASVFGYACNHTADLMPLPISLANALARQLHAVWDTLDYISPDCTTQVGVEFVNDIPRRIHSITLIIGCDNPEQTPTQMRMEEDLRHHVITPVFEYSPISPDQLTKIVINPSGPFVRSGPAAHSGMTGRKTDSDTYGSFARHSGSALSGKSPSRIDRVGVYAARYAAKNIVASGLAEQCEVQLSYSIGHAGPVSVLLNTQGTGKMDDHEIRRRLIRHFDFRLGAIVRDFKLRQLPALHKGVFYQRLPVVGHFGEHGLVLPWEATDKAALLVE
jgi:S-adenosylmethionine synthetase